MRAANSAMTPRREICNCLYHVDIPIRQAHEHLTGNDERDPQPNQEVTNQTDAQGPHRNDHFWHRDLHQNLDIPDQKTETANHLNNESTHNKWCEWPLNLATIDVARTKNVTWRRITKQVPCRCVQPADTTHSVIRTRLIDESTSTPSTNTMTRHAMHLEP